MFVLEVFAVRFFRSMFVVEVITEPRCSSRVFLQEKGCHSVFACGSTGTKEYSSRAQCYRTTGKLNYARIDIYSRKDMLPWCVMGGGGRGECATAVLCFSGVF